MIFNALHESHNEQLLQFVALCVLGQDMAHRCDAAIAHLVRQWSCIHIRIRKLTLNIFSGPKNYAEFNPVHGLSHRAHVSTAIVDGNRKSFRRNDIASAITVSVANQDDRFTDELALRKIVRGRDGDFFLCEPRLRIEQLPSTSAAPQGLESGKISSIMPMVCGWSARPTH